MPCHTDVGKEQAQKTVCEENDALDKKSLIFWSLLLLMAGVHYVASTSNKTEDYEPDLVT